MKCDISHKENYLETIRFGSPRYVPKWDENVIKTFSFADICRLETWTDRWGVGWVKEMDGTVPFPKVNPLPDVRAVADFAFPDPQTLTMDESTLHGIKEIDRHQHILIGSMTYLNFERAWALMGMENFLVAMIEFPKQTKFLVRRIAEYARVVFQRYLEMGFDGVSFSEDLGSQKALMMSPTLFREYFLPAYEHCFSDVLRAGKMVNFHSCGCVDEIAGDLADLGVTVLNPIQARANNLQAIKQRTLGKTALSGGIDTDLILRGHRDQVYAETVRVLSLLKPGGGYICGPDQSFPEFPPENIAAMNDAWNDEGWY